MLSAVWAARWYLLLGLLSLLVFLAVTVPLNLVWQTLEPNLGRLPVQVNSVSGTVWDGRFQIRERQLGVLNGEWQLQPLSLLSGSAVADVAVNSDSLRLTANLQASANGDVQISELDGYFDPLLLAPMLRRQRVSFDGDIEASKVAATLNANTLQVAEVSGRIIYQGGSAEFPVQGKPVSAEIPMIIGNLSMEGDKAVVNIENTDSEALAQGFLQPDGWAGVAVRRRFIDTLGQQWPQKADADTVIFEVSHKIL